MNISFSFSAVDVCRSEFVGEFHEDGQRRKYGKATDKVAGFKDILR